MIEVSVTGLGELEKCERCFWFRMKRIYKPQIFPSILKSMDSLVKADAALRTQRGQRIRWLPSGTVLAGIKKSMSAVYNDVRLKGEIDELVKVPNGYKVIDYKTSASPYDLERANHYYQTAISAYAFLCEQNGFRPVVGGELVFYCPAMMNDKIATFEITRVPTVINIGKIKQMMVRAKEISMMSNPPFGNCEWCRYVDARCKFQR